MLHLILQVTLASESKGGTPQRTFTPFSTQRVHCTCVKDPNPSTPRDPLTQTPWHPTPSINHGSPLVGRSSPANDPGASGDRLIVVRCTASEEAGHDVYQTNRQGGQGAARAPFHHQGQDRALKVNAQPEAHHQRSVRRPERHD